MKIRKFIRDGKKGRVYYPEVIPSISKHLEKLARSSSRHAEEVYRRETIHRQNLKHNRILHTKEDKHVHALDILIEKAEEARSPTSPVDYAQGGSTFSIDYYNFNFEDRRDRAELFENFLNELKVEKCISGWQHNPFTPSIYIFSEVNVDGLKRCRNRLKQREEWENLSLYFGFEGKKFWLKLLDGGIANIDFHQKKGEKSNTLYLMRALIEHLKIFGHREGSWAKVICDRKGITDYIKKEFKASLGQDPNYWLKSTRGNLIKKIQEEYLDLIKIGNYSARLSGFPFELKLPI